jgi:outer membrane protein
MNKEKDVRELQRQKFGPEGALFKKREELVKPVQDKVYGAIERFATDKGFEFIFDKGSASGLLFSDSKNDKTDDIKALVKK